MACAKSVLGTAVCAAALLGVADCRRSAIATSDLDVLHEVVEAQVSLAVAAVANRSKHFLHEVGANSFGAVRESAGRQVQVPTTVTNTSFLDEMGNAVGACILGFVMVIFSIPVLFFNERQNARAETLLDRAAVQYRTVTADTASKENRGWLVHIQNTMLIPTEAVADQRFHATLETNCVRLSSEIEVFQWVEHSQQETRNKFGGGKETITTYRYTQEWLTSCVESSRFQDRTHQNTWPDGLVFGSETRECGRVEFGTGFLLSSELVAQSRDFQSAADRLGDTVTLRNGGSLFRRGPDGMFYFRVGDDRWAGVGTPEVGDTRVTFKYVAGGPASVMALQVAGPEGEERDSFLPYRLISRPFFFSMKEEDEKAALTAQAQKSMVQLADEDRIGGDLFVLFCCAFACVDRICSMLAPEIQHLFIGDVEASDCLRRIATMRGWTTWFVRFIGWFMMFIGLYATFSPFITMLNVIPLIGALGSAAIWVCCFLSTVVTAIIVISFAYLLYNPFRALLTAILALKIASLPLVIAVLLGWRPLSGGI